MFKKIAFFSGIAVAAIVTLSLFNQIRSALTVSDRVGVMAEDLQKAQIKNKELKEKLTQIKSPQYVEEIARDKLGLARPGETVVVIPDEKIRQILGASASAEIRLPNWLGWLKVFWH